MHMQTLAEKVKKYKNLRTSYIWKPQKYKICRAFFQSFHMRIDGCDYQSSVLCNLMSASGGFSVLGRQVATVHPATKRISHFVTDEGSNCLKNLSCNYQPNLWREGILFLPLVIWRG